MPIRYDKSLLGTIKKTAQGYLEIPIVIGKADCVLSYRRSDGTTVKEFRSSKEVMKADSIETAKAAQVTVGHRANLDTSNTRKFSVGSIRDDILPEGNLLVGKALITDKEAIEKIENKDLRDASPGYRVDIEEIPGIFNGEHYDQSQKNIVYNHVALIPPGTGRQGVEVGLRLDSNDGIEIDESEERMKVKFRLDGKDYEVEVSDETGAQLVKDLDQRNDANQKEIEKLKGQIAVIEKTAKEDKDRADKAESLDTINEIVATRLDAIEKIKTLDSKVKTEDLKLKSIKDLRLDALELAGFARETFKEKSDDYIEGSFSSVGIEVRSDDKIKGVGSPVATPRFQVVKTDKDDTSKSAKDEMNLNLENAWKSKEVK